jgi:hypothetical protein
MKILHYLFCLLICISSRTYAQDDLLGKWQGTLEGEYYNSTVTWVFSDQTYELDLENDGSIEVVGRWETEGNHLYLWDTGGPMGCPESQRGEYSFVISENMLQLNLLEDICPGRKMMGPNIKWIRKD